MKPDSGDSDTRLLDTTPPPPPELRPRGAPPLAPARCHQDAAGSWCDSSSGADAAPPVGRLVKRFHYEQLDDEFGSRCCGDEAGAPPPRRLVVPPSPASPQHDRIVGHADGVRPLLDDDELSEAETNPFLQSSGDGDGGQEGGAGEEAGEEGGDPFGAAPFRRRTDVSDDGFLPAVFGAPLSPRDDVMPGRAAASSQDGAAAALRAAPPCDGTTLPRPVVLQGMPASLSPPCALAGSTACGAAQPMESRPRTWPHDGLVIGRASGGGGGDDDARQADTASATAVQGRRQRHVPLSSAGAEFANLGFMGDSEKDTDSDNTRQSQAVW